MHIHTGSFSCTHYILVKYYRDLLGRQNSERGMDEVTFFYVDDLFSRNLREDFFLKIGILSAKVYTKKDHNIEGCKFIHAPLRILSTKQVVVVLYW